MLCQLALSTAVRHCAIQCTASACLRSKRSSTGALSRSTITFCHYIGTSQASNYKKSWLTRRDESKSSSKSNERKNHETNNRRRRADRRRPCHHLFRRGEERAQELHRAAEDGDRREQEIHGDDRYRQGAGGGRAVREGSD